ncbi:hypothetical protein D3C72_1063600 [compost metagenome]
MAKTRIATNSPARPGEGPKRTAMKPGSVVTPWACTNRTAFSNSGQAKRKTKLQPISNDRYEMPDWNSAVPVPK